MPYSERRHCKCPEHCETEPLRAFLDWFTAHALDYIPNDVYHRTGGYELLRAVEEAIGHKEGA